MRKICVLFFLFFTSCSSSYYYDVYDSNDDYLGELISYTDTTIYLRSPNGYYYTLDENARFAQTYPIYSTDTNPTSSSQFYIDTEWQGNKQYGMFTTDSLTDVSFCYNNAASLSVSNLYRFLVNTSKPAAHSYVYEPSATSTSLDVLPVITDSSCNNSTAELPPTITPPFYSNAWYSYWGFIIINDTKASKKV